MYGGVVAARVLQHVIDVVEVSEVNVMEVAEMKMW